MSNDQIIKYIKDNYKIYSYNDPYLWSTFILPTGEFIVPENEEYEDDIGEHANIIAGIAENCFDDDWMAAEDWLTDNCIKCNVTFPYIVFPSNPTNKQYWAAESWLEGLKKRGADSYYIREESPKAFNMDAPIQIMLGGKLNAGNIYDMSVYEPDEIIDLVKRGRVSGMLSEAAKVKVDEDMELNQVPDRKPDGQSRITFGDGNRERILVYLGLDSFSDLDELEDAIARAFEVEDEYLHQLKRGDFGYALTADFESIPHIIEDPAEYKDLEEIESFGGITVYRKIKK